jgi:hypothetical protein
MFKMKKLFIFLLLSYVLGVSAQSTITPSYPTIKISKPTTGTTTDDIVLRNAASGGVLKILPVSEIKGITNLNQLATPTGVIIYSDTGTDAVLPLATTTNAGLQSPSDKTKIDGIATGATANQTDTYLLSRANHTGAQAISTVTGLQTSLDTKVDKVAGERLINAAEITKLSNQSGTNTGDETAATIKTKLGITTLSGSNTGDQTLSSLGGVSSNTAITGATNTKITYDSKGLVTGGTGLIASDIPTLNQNTTGSASTITGNITESQVTNLVTDLSNKQSISSKGVAGGYASLDGSGKVPLTQINDVLLGSVNYQGIYNAATNVPALPTVSTSNKGFYFVVSTAGTQAGLTLNAGDWIISNGTAWGKIDNNNAVTAVNSVTGNVTLTTSNIPEGSNLYYTDARVNTNANVAANTAARHNAVTIGTANGLSLSTQSLSLGLSSTSTTGALSSTDWNTFNNKQNNDSRLYTYKGAVSYNTNADNLLTNGVYLNTTGNGTGNSNFVDLYSIISVIGNNDTNYGRVQISYNGLGEQKNRIKFDAGFTNWRTVWDGVNLNLDGLTINYIPKRVNSGFVNSQIFDNGINVGIGTQTPTEKLDVVGNIKVSGDIIGTSANFSSTVTIIDPVNPYNAATKKYVDAAVATKSYKVFSALYSQNSTSNPTVIILENTLGSVTFSRSSNGVYSCNSSGLFTADKTFVYMGAGTNAAYINAISLFSSSTFYINTKLSSTQADVDSANTKVAFEIRVYN